MEVNLIDVTYQYSGNNKNTLSNINMNIEEGKITGIVGKSGSGKTTLIELINAFRLPKNGYIKIGEFLITNEFEEKSKMHFKVGMLSQNPDEQFFCLTVKEELEMPLKFYGYTKHKMLSRIKDALAMVRLNESILNKNPKNLSNSEKRKLGLALILIINPEVIILDEPIVGYDADDIKNLIKLIRLLKNRYHKTIIIASHNTDFLHKIVDYIYVLSEGKIVMEGNKYDVFKEEQTLKKYGVKSPNLISFPNKVLKNKNVKIGYRDEINDLMKDIYRYVR